MKLLAMLFAALVILSLGVTAKLTDDFNRADNTTLGEFWLENETAAADIQILSNVMMVDQVVFLGGGAYVEVFWEDTEDFWVNFTGIGANGFCVVIAEERNILGVSPDNQCSAAVHKSFAAMSRHTSGTFNMFHNGTAICNGCTSVGANADIESHIYANATDWTWDVFNAGSLLNSETFPRDGFDQLFLGEGNSQIRFSSWVADASYDDVNISASITPPDKTSKLTVTAQDLVDKTQLNNLTVYLTNSTHTLINVTESGSTLFGDLANQTTYTVNVSSNDTGGYFQFLGSFFINHFGVATPVYQANMTQAYVIFNASQKYTQLPLLGINVTDNTVLRNYSTNFSLGQSVIIPSKAGNYNASLAVAGQFNATHNYTLAPLDTLVVQREFFDAYGNLTVFNENDLLPINVNYTLNVTFGNISNTTFLSSKVADTNWIPLLKGYNVSFFIMPEEVFSDKLQTFPVNSTYFNYTMTTGIGNTVYIEIFNEIDNSLLSNTTVTLNFIGLSSEALTFNVTTSNGTLFKKISTGDYEIRYLADGYDKRSHFFNLTVDNSDQLDLYLLNSSLSSQVVATVVDQDENPVQAATISILKFFVDESAFKVVEMVRTDSLGKNPFNIVPNTQEYQFLIEYNNSVVFQSEVDTKITTDEINFRINLIADLFEAIQDLQNVDTDLSFDNTTGKFTFTFVDVSGELQEACLDVIRFDGLKDVTETNCLSATSGTIVFTIPDNSSSYRAIGRLQGSFVISDIVSVVSSEAREVFGATGAFLAMLVIIAIVLTGIFAPEQMIIATSFGLIVVGAIGLFTWNSGTIATGMIIMGLIIAYLARSR